jgi:hypothetical protein
LRTLENDDVAGVNLADGGDNAAVEGFELRVEARQAVEGGDGFIEEVVAENGGLAVVARGDALPEGDRAGLSFLALEEPGVAPAIVDVRAGLSRRRGV